MQRGSAYAYAPYPAPPAVKQYPAPHSTSSAFSASANPNEDWTKISDLAERRRIQNRIAQRNYRKKLKKRLEDLERRAGSSSASPEQRHEELPSRGDDDDDDETLSSAPPASDAAPQRRRRSGNQARRHQQADSYAQPYVLPTEDRGMFSQQSTRELSTSPPPFSSYASMSPPDTVAYSNYPGMATYYAMPHYSGADMPMCYPHAPALPQQQYSVPHICSPPVKQEFYGDDEISPFSMSYASINDVPPYQELPPYVRYPRKGI